VAALAVDLAARVVVVRPPREVRRLRGFAGFSPAADESAALFLESSAMKSTGLFLVPAAEREAR
jgi:hypothetical protein